MYNTNPFAPNYFNGIYANTSSPTFNIPVAQPQMEIQRVNGEESAKAYPIGPNSSVLLLDVNDPLVWVVTTDASGFKTVTPYTITPYQPEKPISADDIRNQMEKINSRLDRLEERMNTNGQSNNGANWKNKSGNGNAQPNVRNGQSGQGSAGSDKPNSAE